MKWNKKKGYDLDSLKLAEIQDFKMSFDCATEKTRKRVRGKISEEAPWNLHELILK